MGMRSDDEPLFVDGIPVEYVGGVNAGIGVLEHASQALADGRRPLSEVLDRFLDGLCLVHRASTPGA